MFLPTEGLDKMRVVIADANQVVRTWLRTQLSQAGVKHVAMAGTAGDLLRQCAGTTPDVVLCDHNFGEKHDGLRTLEELRLNNILPLSSVFIIVTGERLRARVVSAAEFAPDDYLLKPFTSGQLAERLERAVEKKLALKAVFVEMAQRNLPGVILECDRVVERTPRYALDALRIRAEALIALGRLDEASEIYQAIIARNSVPWARIGYAMVLRERGEAREAAELAAQISEEFPDFMGVYDFLGELHERNGELAEARTYYERADSIAPDNLRRLRSLGEICLELGDVGQAATVMRRVVDRTEGTSLSCTEDHLTLIKSLVGLDDTDAEINQRMQEMRTMLGDSERAAVLSDVIEARRLSRNGDEEGARRAIDQALKTHEQLRTPDTLATTELAEACLQTDRQDAAEKLISTLPDAPGVLPNRLKRQSQSARDRARAAAAQLEAERAEGPDLDHIEAELTRLGTLIKRLDVTWDDALAADARNILIDAFTLAPRERSVIDAHIHYNRVAQKHGFDRHKPTARASSPD
ncbi:tetratricopeptide repeat family protein [Methyloversatilis sp. RAC08]|uniref:tetratricopeptide repeat protein n=1 Tax=Methyloversatilis sp. RAC08 TaxID=1842540 RepID=UPI00083CBCEF|nr:response regulator [Methyloversatilis sp. RAC08]AOF82155.1 tetratricopeptide repeat family protein [Methyloversatilis sp. RAC08]